jgi:hypothetical protein
MKFSPGIWQFFIHSSSSYFIFSGERFKWTPFWLTVARRPLSSSFVSGARFATAEWISFKLGFLVPPGNTPRLISQELSRVLYIWQAELSHVDFQWKKFLLLSPGGAIGQNVTAWQAANRFELFAGNQLRMSKAYSEHVSSI